MTDRIIATFSLSESGLGDQVCVTLSRQVHILRFPPEVAYFWAEKLLLFARQAERNRAGHQALTPKEVDRIEEAILGRPTLRDGGSR